ncbi:hypothetical protein ACM6QP_16080, partial [Enterococcus faecium]
ASNKKIKRIYATEKGKNVYPIIVRENQYSNQVALQGLSEVEISQLADYLVRMRNQIVTPFGHQTDHFIGSRGGFHIHRA